MGVFKKKASPVSSAPEQSVVVGKPTPQFKRINSKSLAMALTLALMIGAGLYVGFKLYQKQRTKQNKVAAQIVCTDEKTEGLMLQAASNLAPSKNEQLKPLVDRLSKLKDYTHDPNCLYPIVIYRINVNDSLNARKSFEDFKRVYDSGVEMLDIFPKSEDVANDLEKSIQTVEKFRKELDANAVYSN